MGTTVKENFERIPSITPWDELEIGKMYITPKIQDIPRMSIVVISKCGDTMVCDVKSSAVTERVTIHKTSIAAKFMVEEIEF